MCDTNAIIFLAMKTARIKSRNGPFLLESTDSRISQTHEKVSSYRQKGVQTVITKTVLSEFGSDKVRRIVDEKCHFLNYAQRAFVIHKVLKKRDEILLRFASRDIPREELKEFFEKVMVFYKDPKKGLILEELSRKKGRGDILPEYGDRIILSECCWLKDKEKKEIIFITDDGDFIEFAKDIQNTFGVRVESIL